jgi:hypothetical protein
MFGQLSRQLMLSLGYSSFGKSAIYDERVNGVLWGPSEPAAVAAGNWNELVALSPQVG